MINGGWYWSLVIDVNHSVKSDWTQIACHNPIWVPSRLIAELLSRDQIGCGDVWKSLIVSMLHLRSSSFTRYITEIWMWLSNICSRTKSSKSPCTCALGQTWISISWVRTTDNSESLAKWSAAYEHRLSTPYQSPTALSTYYKVFRDL